MPPLPRSFYTRTDVVQIARDLLGKEIFTRIGGITTSGIICETEAYAGATDRASHAYGNRRTQRTEIMYAEGGTAYIYLCYGIHSLLNVVTNSRDIPHAVLIRGIMPFSGIETMLKRAGKEKGFKAFGIGPGNVSKILGIHYSLSGSDLVNKTENLNEPSIWIEDNGIIISPGMIESAPRIGVDYAGEDALRPYRFMVKKGVLSPYSHV
jgi:DNA-3-methyladenine glycosylase